MAKQGPARVETRRVQTQADAIGGGPKHEDIAALAYSLWQARGCPQGTPEQDWFVAERSLKAKAPTASSYRP